MSNIHLVLGDITEAEVEAIVNAANSQMLGGGGVDGAIHAAAGPELLEACYQVPAVDGVRCPPGEARITSAGKLKSRHVIHTVGPIYHQEQSPATVLRAAYQNTCRLALQHGCESVAFPAISCGVYGYPHREAAEVAVAACSAAEFSALTIAFYLFNAELYDVFARALNTHQ